MSRLSKTQRNQLIGIAVATVGLMAVLWFVVVAAERRTLSDMEGKRVQMQDRLKKAERVIRRSEEIAGQLQARQQLLDKRETTLAPDRGAYEWIISTINPMILSRPGVSIYYYSQPEVGDAGIIPDFPYRWALFHVKGIGYYHDFGKFFADVENDFPYFRVQSLSISIPMTTEANPEKLDFAFELVVPVKASDTK